MSDIELKPTGPEQPPRGTPSTARHQSTQEPGLATYLNQVPHNVSSYVRSVDAAGPLKSIPILEIIQRTNEYLASSTPEHKLTRADRCQELEFWLLTTGNQVSYDFLDQRASDTTRRRYTIPAKLLVP